MTGVMSHRRTSFLMTGKETLMARTVGLVHVPDRPCGDDPDMWYSLGALRIVRAKEVCSGCPFRVRCLWTALVTNERHGIWGGLDTAERDDLQRQLRGETLAASVDVHTVPGPAVLVAGVEAS